jgi:hypothetical protein
MRPLDILAPTPNLRPRRQATTDASGPYPGPLKATIWLTGIVGSWAVVAALFGAMMP